MASARFIDSVDANLAYWHLQSASLSPNCRLMLQYDRLNLLRATEYGIALSAVWRETVEPLLSPRDMFDESTFCTEWIPLLEGAISRCEEPDLVLKCRLLNLVGLLYMTNRELDSALERLLDARAIAVSLQDLGLMARCHIELSRLQVALRNHERAERAATKALAEYQQLGGDPRMVASCHMSIGLSAQALGDLDRAEFNMRQSVAHSLAVDDLVNQARALHDLGIILYARGEHAEALKIHLRALSLLDNAGSELDKVMVHLSLGTLYSSQGELDLAEATCLQANSPFLCQSKHTYHQALVASNLSNVYLARGHLGKAVCWLEAAVRLWRAAGAGLNLANTLGDMAQVRIRLGQKLAALAFLEEAPIITEAFRVDAWARILHDQLVEARASLDGCLT
jgi:tetratricopeptide (TPR) repeat protein